MNLPRQFWIGAGGLAFAFAVVAMVPPTKPLGGPKIDPNAHHGLAALPPPKPAPVVPQPQVQPDPKPEGFSGPAATVASSASESWPWREADAEQPQQDFRAPPIPPNAVPTYRAQPQPRYAYSDAQPVSPQEDRAYRAGFRWAQRQDLDDPRACQMIDGGPGTDGCLSYLRNARRDRYARDDEDDGPPPWWR